MATTKRKPFSVTRLNARGQLTLPAEYRRSLAPSGDASVVLIPLGEGLVIAPCDAAFDEVTRRLEARMHAAGSDVADLLAAAADARAALVREEFGDLIDE